VVCGGLDLDCVAGQFVLFRLSRWYDFLSMPEGLR